MTYTEQHQRELDQQEIGPDRTPRADLVRERMQRMTAEALSWELVEALLAAIADDKGWRREAQALLRQIEAGDYPEPRT